MEILLHKTSES